MQIRPIPILLSLASLAACGGPDAPLDQDTAALVEVTETAVHFHPDAEPTVESHRIFVAPEALPEEGLTAQGGAGLTADSVCGGASLWLYDAVNLGGNRICFFEPGYGPKTIELSAYCRASSRTCSAPLGGPVTCTDTCSSTWSGAVRSLWAGSDEGYLSYGGPTGCFDHFTPYQRENTVAWCASYASTIELDRWPSSSFIPTRSVAYDYPSNSSPDWAYIVQGVAHDANNWFITAQYGIYKMPVDHPLDDHDGGWRISATIPSALWAAGYNHFGDPEEANGFVYVPLEGSRAPLILAYDSNLNLIASAELTVHGETNEAPWVAVNPKNGLIYTSNFQIRPDNPIRVYRPRILPGFGVTLFFLDYVGTYVIRDEAGTPMSLGDVQGGAFTSNGHLYLVSDVAGSVQSFDASGRRRSVLAVDYTGHESRQELEGLTFWDLDSGRAPNIRGQLHLMMAKRDLDASRFNSVYFKHYELADPGEKPKM
ncbi:MAG: hypothetical protein U1E65_09915 [Myxococcota bacterium]